MTQIERTFEHKFHKGVEAGVSLSLEKVVAFCTQRIDENLPDDKVCSAYHDCLRFAQFLKEELNAHR